MSDFDISRRGFVAGAPLVAGAGLLATTGCAQASSSDADYSPDQVAEMLQDPGFRARVRARVIGSCGEEESIKLYRLNIYGHLPDGNLIPFFTMNHLSISDWVPQDDGTFQSTTYECGYYCEFDTDEPIDIWRNPVTGEDREVFHFLGGPFTVIIGPDGVVTRNADLQPQVLRMEQIGHQLHVPTIASMKMPNFVDPEKYPDLYSGPEVLWESQATFSTNIADAMNDDLTKALAYCHFQNLASWHPWLGMGARAGRTYGNARGTKLKSINDVPTKLLEHFERYTPLILNRSEWTEPKNEVLEYLALQDPA